MSPGCCRVSLWMLDPHGTGTPAQWYHRPHSAGATGSSVPSVTQVGLAAWIRTQSERTAVTSVEMWGALVRGGLPGAQVPVALMMTRMCQ